ncbi:MAG: RNase adapter RapZ [Pseudomonadota bacterium]
MRILIVTGLSGAGKSVALKTLEDIGCEAVDNVPMPLIPSLIATEENIAHNLAIGIDVRSRDFSFEYFQQMLKTIRKNKKHKIKVIFLDCDDKVLQLRFTETRRKHPLALDRPVIDGISHERELLLNLRDIADVTFDTTEWNSSDLRNAIREYYGNDNMLLSLSITSFSFKRGLPRDADLVFDVRFLKNPFYDDKLRSLSGLDPAVANFIEKDIGEKDFFNNLTNLIEPLLPRYLKEGKSYLTIAIGCTGGQHRSVFICEKLAGFLRNKDYKVGIRHRDLDPKTQKINS